MSATNQQKFVVFVGPDDARLAMPAGLVERLEEFSPDQVQRSGPQWEAQSQEGTLPLIRLEQVLEERRSSPRYPDLVWGDDRPSYPVVVFRSGGQSVGLVVYSIVDTVDIGLSVKRPASRGGVAYTVEVDDRIVEIVDVAQLTLRDEHKPKEQPELTR
jgi:two-component system, chemotaxis family, sensor kinase CheA